MKSASVLASAGAALLMLGGAAALNSLPYTVDLLPSDPMLVYGGGRGRPGDAQPNTKWNLTYDGLAWNTYQPGQEWSDKRRFALSAGDMIKLPVHGVRVTLEGTSLSADECVVQTSYGGAGADTFTFRKGEMTTKVGDNMPMRYYNARIIPACNDMALLSVAIDTRINVSQKTLQEAIHQTHSFIAEGNALAPFFEQSGNVVAGRE